MLLLNNFSCCFTSFAKKHGATLESLKKKHLLGILLINESPVSFIAGLYNKMTKFFSEKENKYFTIGLADKLKSTWIQLLTAVQKAAYFIYFDFQLLVEEI